MYQAVGDLRDFWYTDARLPSLNRYVLYLAAMYRRFQGVHARFPRVNARSDGAERHWATLATDPDEMLCIANQLYVLRSNGMEGHLLEFGCFKGHSSCCLSNACHELGIGMEIFDSFAGLPDSGSDYYAAGDFRGSFEEVTAHMAEFGKPEVARYWKGYFAETVPRFPEVPVLCLWMDVDLHASARDVAPLLDRLPPQCTLFTHEFPPDGAEGGRVLPEKSQVFPPILDRMRALARDPVGRYLCGYTGAIWDARDGIPVLPHDCVRSLAGLVEG
jgi:hypothetical protein